MHLENIVTIKNVKSKKGPQHRQLKAFVGHWRIEGEDLEHRPVSGEETFEWFDGDYFLVRRSDWRFELQAGENFLKGMGWIGFDSERGTYFSYSISSSGQMKIFEVEVSDHLLVFSGETERATIRLGPEGETLQIFWDECRDGENWHSLCNLTGYLQSSKLEE